MKKKKFSEIIKEHDEQELILEHNGVIERAKNELVQALLDNDDSLTLEALKNMKGKVQIDAKLLALVVESLLADITTPHVDIPPKEHSVTFSFDNGMATYLFSELSKKLNNRGIKSIAKGDSLHILKIGRQ